MNWLWFFPVMLLLVGVGGGLLWRPLHRFGREVQAERARESFRLQRERLEAQFLQAAARVGKPRGARWTDSVFEDRLFLVRDRRSGHLLGLLPLSIHFEAVAGEAMEDVEAVGHSRKGSAIFFFDRGQWHTAGKTLFNMAPEQALDYYWAQYERLPTAGEESAQSTG